MRNLISHRDNDEINETITHHTISLRLCVSAGNNQLQLLIPNP